jgi:hypothetical protein
MDFSQTYLEKMVRELSMPEMKLSDMPEIDLYVEQLTSLLESRYSRCKRNETDKIFTRAMINNYTKMGLLMPPENKKYSREHMILLNLIYYLKNVLSINDIKALFSPVLNNISTRDDDIMSLEDIYSVFIDLHSIDFDNFYDSFVQKIDLINEKTENIEKENRDLARLFLFVIMLVAQSNAQKRLAERIIDDFFVAK